MLKRVVLISIAAVFLFQGAAHAQAGGVILEDTLYGALLGGILGAAVYLLDENDLSEKVGTGVGIGTIGGFLFGVTDAATMVQVEEGKVKFAAPPVIIERRGDATVLKTSLIGVRF
jgi:hypothetical protein